MRIPAVHRTTTVYHRRAADDSEEQTVLIFLDGLPDRVSQ